MKADTAGSGAARQAGRAEDVIYLDEAGTLDGLFRKRVRRSPDRIAYRFFDKAAGSWTDVTWAGVARQVAAWQAALARENLRPGDRVALALRNGVNWAVFDQAAMGLGLVVVPLYMDDRPDNVAYILGDAAAKLLVVQDGTHWGRLAPALEEVACLERVVILKGAGDGTGGRVAVLDDWLPEGEHALQERAGDPGALATIVYTSGTTGRPKGVMLSHRNILSVAHAALTMHSVYREEVFLSFLPLAHTLERTAGHYLPMMAGATVAYARSINQLAEDLRVLRPTIMIAVPRIFERLHARLRHQVEESHLVARWLFAATVRVGWRRFEVEQGRRRWGPQLLLWPLLRRLVADKVSARLGGRLGVAVSGGAALSPEIGRELIALGLPILQGYGLTETSPVISVNLPKRNEPSSVGVPLRGIQVRIGAEQELQVHGPGVMLGYWNNHAATAAVIDSDGWLRTGDQARIENGHIYIVGRIKDVMVLSNGEKVPPGEMEAAITRDPLFEQVVIVGEGRPFLSALVVLNGDLWPGAAQDLGLDPLAPGSLSDRRITGAAVSRIARLLHDFPSYAKVRRVFLTLEPWTVENGFLTPTLKIKRARVLDHYSQAVEGIYAKGPAAP